jgi:hypothetical protein
MEDRTAKPAPDEQSVRKSGVVSGDKSKGKKGAVAVPSTQDVRAIVQMEKPFKAMRSTGKRYWWLSVIAGTISGEEKCTQSRP